MNRLLLLLFTFVTTFCISQDNDTLYIYFDETTELPGYVNSNGDTIIEAGIFEVTVTDQFTDYFLVIDTVGKSYAINRNLDTLYEVYWYDNGPDYIEEGMFRIVENGKIGYANEKGEIIIAPKYECAGIFQDGMAVVAYKCDRVREDEFFFEVSNDWLRIDREGNEFPMPND